MVSLNLLALVTVAAALEVTSPSSSTVWTVGDSQTVTWDSVSTDQSTFNIYLSNMVNYPSTTVLLASDVSKSAGSATIDGSKLTAGHSFTINFTNGTNTEQLYAQSNQFNITASSSSSSSSSSTSSSATSSASGSTSTSASGTATSASATSSGTSSGSTASSTATGTTSSSTSTAASTSGAGKIIAGWVGVIALAALSL